MGSTAAKVLIGVLSFLTGFFSAISVINYQSCRDTKKLARILLVEVKHNYGILEDRAEAARSYFGAKTTAEIRSTKEYRPGNPSLMLTNFWDFRRTVFDATLPHHGVLPEKILKDVHTFYWELHKIDRLMQFAEKNAASRDIAARDVKSSFHHAVAALELAKKTDLLSTLEHEANRGSLYCLRPKYLWG